MCSRWVITGEREEFIYQCVCLLMVLIKMKCLLFRSFCKNCMLRQSCILMKVTHQPGYPKDWSLSGYLSYRKIFTDPRQLAARPLGPTSELTLGSRARKARCTERGWKRCWNRKHLILHGFQTTLLLGYCRTVWLVYSSSWETSSEQKSYII